MLLWCPQFCWMHTKCEWDLIHGGDLGQLKVVSPLKTGHIRMKFQNLILIGCWKFGGKFHSCPQAQTYSLYKVKAPFRCPWEIINVFSHAVLLPSCTILVETEIPFWRCSRILVFASCPTSSHFGGFPRLAFFWSGIWRSFSSCCLTIWWYSLWEEVQRVSQQSCCHAF